jgi:Flp pilus assembly secretin CpaC
MLARIPIIKNLFGSTKKEDSRKELMIFIQPSIIRGPEDLIESNSREIQRTKVGAEAMTFANPAVDMKDVVMPTAQGNIPYDSAGYPNEKPGFWRKLGGMFKRKTNVPAEATSPNGNGNGNGNAPDSKAPAAPAYPR